MSAIDWKDPEQVRAYRREKAREMRADPEFRDKANKDKRELYAPRYRFKIIEKKYGITEDQYNKMFALQEGCCKICKKHQQDLPKKLFIDHDHNTGKVRGLLCQQCNSLLGMASDNEEILKAAVEYLRENQ